MKDRYVAEDAITALRKFFFETMEIPATLGEVGINEESHFDEMAEKAARGGKRWFVPLTKEDVIEIFRAAK